VVEGASFVFRPSFEQHVWRMDLSAGFASGIFWSKGALGAILSSGEDIDPALEAQLGSGFRTSFGLAVALDAVVHAPARSPRIIDVTGVGNTRYVGLDLGLAWWLLDHLAVSTSIGIAPSAASNAATPSLNFGLEIRS
jgi:hypothetical protein